MNALQVSKRVGVSERTVRRAIAEGRLEAAKIRGEFQIDLVAAARLWPRARADSDKLIRLAQLRKEIPSAREYLLDLQAEALSIITDLQIEMEVV